MARKRPPMTWNVIVTVIKLDAEENDYVVDFLQKRKELIGIAQSNNQLPCYIYFKDDDQSAIYELNDQHRAQMEHTLSDPNLPVHEVADKFWSELNQHYRMTQ